MVIQGFDDGVQSMDLGEKKTIVIPVSQAYGEPRKDLIVDFPRSEFPDDLELEIARI